MGRRSRKAHRRRNRRGLLFTTAVVTAGLLVGGVAIGTVVEGGLPGRTSADAAVVQEADLSPAAGPLHKDAPTPVTSIPKNDPARGLIYNGLVPAAKGDRCVGVFKADDKGLCTHGPDAPPKGVDVHKSAPPAVAAGGAPAAPTAAATAAADTAPSAADLLQDAAPVLDARSGDLLGGTAAPAAGTPAATAP
ncbi:hypothetical protein ACFQMG_12855, partial [Kitasatospora paranensis]